MLLYASLLQVALSFTDLSQGLPVWAMAAWGVLTLGAALVSPLACLAALALLIPSSPQFVAFGLPMRLGDPLVGVACLHGLRLVLRRPLRLRRLRSWWDLALLAAVACLTTLIGMAFTPNGHEPALPYALKTVHIAAIAPCVLLLARSGRTRRWILGAFFAGGVLMLLQTQYFDVEYGPITYVRLGAENLGEQPNILAMTALFALIALVCVEGVRGHLLRILRWLVALGLCWAIAESRSRTTWAAMAVAGLAGLLVGVRRIDLLLLGGWCALWILLQEEGMQRVASLAAPSADAAMNYRQDAFQHVLYRVFQSPFTALVGEGRGVETMSYADSAYGIELLYGGLLGLGAFVVLLWRRLAACVRELAGNRVAAGGALMLVIASIVASIALVPLQAARTGESFMVLLPLLLPGSMRATSGVVSGRGLRIAALTPVVLAVMILVVMTARGLTREPQIAQPLPGMPPSLLESGVLQELESGAGRLRRFELRVGKDPGVPMRFVLIPASSFLMGSDSGNGDEMPIHAVLLQSFLMAEHEVSNDQYRALASLGLREVAADHPVVDVSWLDALAWCESARKATGLPIDLPTEAEWEYACRAGRDDRNDHYSSGATLEAASALWRDAGRAGPRAVSRGEPNPWGLYNMHGNLWEWTLDAYRNDAYGNSNLRAGPRAGEPRAADQAPGRDNPFISIGDHRVIRGGAYTSSAIECRSAEREKLLARAGRHDVGFRPVIRLGE